MSRQPSLDFAILAAGAGSRFGPLGRVIPKAAYPIGRQPLIALQLAAISAHPWFEPMSSEVRVLIPEQDERLPELVEATPSLGPVRWIRQFGSGRAADAVRAAIDVRRGRTLVCMVGDSYFPTHVLQRVALRHSGSNATTVAVARRRGESVARIAVRLAADRVVGFGADPSPRRRSHLVDAGLWVVGVDDQQRILASASREADRVVELWEGLLAADLPVQHVRLRREFHLGDPEASGRDLLRLVRDIDRVARRQSAHLLR